MVLSLVWSEEKVNIMTHCWFKISSSTPNPKRRTNVDSINLPSSVCSGQHLCIHTLVTGCHLPAVKEHAVNWSFTARSFTSGLQKYPCESQWGAWPLLQTSYLVDTYKGWPAKG